MISQSTNFKQLLEELTKDSSFYYIEKKRISSTENIDGHTVYSHFQRVNEPITPLLLKQHINREINLAISVKNSKSIIFEYSGEYAYAFGSLLFKLAHLENIKKIYIIEYSLSKLTIYLYPNSKTQSKSKEIAKKLSEQISAKLPYAWKVLPDEKRPDNGNLLILPRELITPNWE